MATIQPLLDQFEFEDPPIDLSRDELLVKIEDVVNCCLSDRSKPEGDQFQRKIVKLV